MAGLINRLEINGRLNGNRLVDSGALQNLKNASGSSHLPSVIERTAIHYATTEEWNANRNLIAEKSHIYIYSDYKVIEEDGETVYIPGLKIGDGTSYLIDLPFSSGGESSSHIRVDTTEGWNEQPDLISEENTLYVYMDKDDDGNITKVLFKVGDGTTYLIDIPFASPSIYDFEQHVNDTNIHVTTEEKTFWNNKWRGYLDTENLYFTIR